MEHLFESRFDDLFFEAKSSLRWLSHLNLYSNYEDKVQRHLIEMALLRIQWDLIKSLRSDQLLPLYLVAHD